MTDWEVVVTRNGAGLRIDRRKFLGAVAAAGAVSSTPGRTATPTSTAENFPRVPSAMAPTAHVAAAEAAIPTALPVAQARDGSDFMVDVIKALDIDYLPSNPASSFRGLHESLINYGGNT